jgi:uncharacterized protein YegL
MSWRARRKLSYTFIALLPLLVVAGVIYYTVFFPEPTCSDGIQNGTETGVDCGGVCDKVCQDDTADIDIQWQQSFSVTDKIYNAAAQIENPNVSLEATDVPYRFRLYDPDGLLITERRGQMDILPQPTNLAFEAGIQVNGRSVGSTEFEFLEQPFWEESDRTNARFPVSNKTLTGPTSSNPRLTFDVTNSTVKDYNNVEISAVIRDGNRNPVQVSRTSIGRLPANETASGIFTWREPFPTRTVQCTTPSDTMLLIDRSGSMNDQQDNPPQPFTAVKDAAMTFLELLDSSARSGLVSFAGDVTKEQELTQQHANTLSSVRSMRILPGAEQGVTNLGAAVQSARNVLSQSTGDKEKVMIILTDGKANAPEDPGGEEFARRQITQAKQSDIVVYTIGLGGDVNQQFLSAIASDEDNYFQAASRNELSGIYEQIHSSLCEQAPFITEIITTQYQPFQ